MYGAITQMLLCFRILYTMLMLFKLVGVSVYSIEHFVVRNNVICCRVHIMRLEECMWENAKRLRDKMEKCAQLGRELDRVCSEAARVLQLPNGLTATTRRLVLVFTRNLHS